MLFCKRPLFVKNFTFSYFVKYYGLPKQRQSWISLIFLTFVPKSEISGFENPHWNGRKARIDADLHSGTSKLDYYSEESS